MNYQACGGTAPEVERVPLPAWAVATLSFVATTSLVFLVQPTGPSALYSATIPRISGLTSTVGFSGYVQAATNLGVPVRGERAEIVLSVNSLPNSAEETPMPQSRKIAGLAFGAVVATALSLYNRITVKSPSHANSSALATAVLDAPTTDLDGKGIVSAEEGTDLPFTMAELRDAIPAECFEKSLGWSMFYFARDWAIVAALYYFQPAVFSMGILAKIAWWNVVGFYGWCLFVVGHDCGHGSFSNYGWLNQLLGHICHAPLLVPFNAWRISHRHHHQFHNDVDRDHSWRPSVAENVAKLTPPIKAFRFSPLILLVYPFYLISPSQENGFSGCHFWPWNPLFKKEERLGVAMSALSVVAFLGAIAAATAQFGFWTVFQAYWIPYWIFVAWLDLVTLMQHTDKNALFFRGPTWNYLRGAMSTIDRTYKHLIDPFNLGYGRLIDHLHHNISDGHVVHHIFFTQIPHYRLIAATKAIKPILGKHYRFDDTHILKAFMTTMNECWFVDDIKDGVVTYKGKEDFKAWEAQQKVQGLA